MPVVKKLKIPIKDFNMNVEVDTRFSFECNNCSTVKEYFMDESEMDDDEDHSIKYVKKLMKDFQHISGESHIGYVCNECVKNKIMMENW